jgi:hypothetical protein
MKNPLIHLWLLAASLLLPAVHGEVEKDACPLAGKCTATSPAAPGQPGVVTGADAPRAAAPAPAPRATAPRPIRRALPAHLFM